MPLWDVPGQSRGGCRRSVLFELSHLQHAKLIFLDQVHAVEEFLNSGVDIDVMHKGLGVPLWEDLQPLN